MYISSPIFFEKKRKKNAKKCNRCYVTHHSGQQSNHNVCNNTIESCFESYQRQANEVNRDYGYLYITGVYCYVDGPWG